MKRTVDEEMAVLLVRLGLVFMGILLLVIVGLK